MPTPVRSTAAFAPAHVTGLFSPRLTSRDPRGRGSVGAGIVLDLGVTARARAVPATRPSVKLSSDVGGPLPISTEVARRLLGERPQLLTVELRHDLPVGQGFGMSAAGALATALAVGKILGVPLPRSITVAHLADLFGRGGLGGVAAILAGGWEVRERPGIPPWGRVHHRRFRRPIVLAVEGAPLASPALLRDAAFRDRVESAARAGLRNLRRDESIDRFLAESERFGDRLHLAGPRLQRWLRSMRSGDVRVSQAMFGRSLFAVARTPSSHRQLLRHLADRGIPYRVVGASATGAGLTPRVSRPSARPRTRVGSRVSRAT
ncbi:MAG: hypothetical protein L3K15_09235 [Thermoplasmata archaeon]|nr:hypothetical protein [Thermoplasmata archaeon]